MFLVPRNFVMEKEENDRSVLNEKKVDRTIPEN
jgi:hypothetical protein